MPVVAGQPVHEGDVLFTEGPVPGGSSSLAQARIEAQFADRDVQRVRRLLGQGLATNQDLTAAEQRAASAHAALRGLGGGGGKQGFHTVAAPADGIVADVKVKRGQLASPGDPAVVLAASNALSVRAGFEMEDLSVLSEGLEVRLTPVLGSGAATPASATLTRLHRMVDEATQLVEALIQVPAPPPWMAPGQRVRVEVITKAVSDAVRVPHEAVIERGGKRGVFLIEGGYAHFRPLAKGLEGTRYVQAPEGVAPGAVVATVGRSSLHDGMAVRATPEHAPSGAAHP